MNLESKFKSLCQTPSDINEHLPTLFRYATECQSVFETGVRCVVSSYALLYGLVCRDSHVNKKMTLNDITHCDLTEFLEICKDYNIDVNYIWKNNLEIELECNYDLTFIDTWHVYGQLKRELTKFSKTTNKYIIMHDTTVDAELGETVRNGQNAEEQSLQCGIPVDEILKGLWPAVEEFLKDNAEWRLKERYENNNGLTVLERV